MNRHHYGLILAGGRGTRFWPRSRKRSAKQVLNVVGERSLIQATVDRLTPIIAPERLWVLTNDHLRDTVIEQLPEVPKRQILAEPMQRNTAPAIGLAAKILHEIDPESVMGVFPSDHVIGDGKRYRAVLKQAVGIAASGDNIVVLGIRPTRAETGYGYIEAGSSFQAASVQGEALRVKRFTEKPGSTCAVEFVKAGNYFWNSGMFLWSARTLANALLEHLPKTAILLQRIAASFGTRKFAATFSRLYRKCENISIDYAVLEPRSAKGEQDSNIICLPADFGWNDLGSWTALHEHHSAKSHPADGNLVNGQGVFTLQAQGNYIHAPGKFVAALGVNNLVVVETEDALLITTREQAQDVGKIVKYLDEKELRHLV